MCSDSCPCETLQEKFWIDTDIELDQFNQKGSITNFKDCYKKLVDSKIVEAIDPYILKIYENFEETNKCSGLCKVPYFWFSKPITQ
jgi:hypothetical protein